MSEKKKEEESDFPETLNKSHLQILETIPESWMLR